MLTQPLSIALHRFLHHGHLLESCCFHNIIYYIGLACFQYSMFCLLAVANPLSDVSLPAGSLSVGVVA